MPAVKRAPARGRWSTFVKDRSVVAIVALWALAVAQPLLDLFGQSPEFFVANGISRLEMVLLAIVIVVIGPIVLIGLQFAVRRWARGAARDVHLATVGLLCALLALSVLRQLDVGDAVVAGAVAVLAGVGGAYVEDTVPPVRTGLCYLALSPILFLVAFLAFSPASDLVWHPGATDVEAGTAGDPAPVVVLSLDEFPLASLLRPDGTINERRFPNFARLADASTWYQDATSMAQTTERSVPSTLTGIFPDPDALPTSRDHPRSLFTLLEEQYDEWVREQVTDVCPESICPSDAGLLDVDRLWSALADSAAVYGHLIAPPSLRDHLPVIDRSWGGFVTDDATTTSSPDEDDAFTSLVDASVAGEESANGPLAPDPACPDAAFWCGAPRIGELAAAIEEPTGDGPNLWVVHATIPHNPWILTPEGHQYLPRSFDTLVVPGLQNDNTWVDDEVLTRQGLQRHLLQVGAVDRQLGVVMDALEAQGLWDDALVVVTADHGIAFTPGQPARNPVASTLAEIFHVPLFIKAPQQAHGEIETGNALTMDVLPTIVDLLDVDTDWEFDGESLASGPHRPDKPVLLDGERSALTTDFDDVLAVAARNQALLPHGDDWLGVAAVGTYGDLVGRPVTAIDAGDPPSGTWRTDQAEEFDDWDPDGGGLTPVLLRGDLRSDATTTPTEALVAVNGTVAGVAVAFHASNDGELTFSAVLAEELLQPGHNEVQLLLPTTIGGRRFHVVPYAG